MTAWLENNWWWTWAIVGGAVYLAKQYAMRYGGEQSLLIREMPIAPERMIAIAGGAFAVILGAGIQLGLKTIDEVALATVGIGLLLIGAGVVGSRRFGIGVIAVLVLAGAVVFGAGVVWRH